MQPIIHQAEVLRSTERSQTRPLKMDTPLRLEYSETGRVRVYATLRSGRFLKRRKTEFLIGSLGPSASGILAPALQREVHLRVRIVNLMPQCLSNSGQERVFLSVWGDAKEFGILNSNRKKILTVDLPNLPQDEILLPDVVNMAEVTSPEPPTPFRIFSRARIRDLTGSTEQG